MTTIELPDSKSVAARMIMTQAYGGHSLEWYAAGDNCDDIRVLLQALRALERGADAVSVHDSGTALRFLLPFMASRPWLDAVLTGSERLCERPVGPLVDALRELGADISYLQEEGCAPLRVKGRPLHSAILDTDPSQSSQFTSALMLLAPTLELGLIIQPAQEPVSWGYVIMTGECMQLAGVPWLLDEKENDVGNIHIPKGKYEVSTFCEADWSAASFFYAAACLMPNGTEFELRGLTDRRLQPDTVTHMVYNTLGVKSTFTEDGVTLRFKERPLPDLIGISAKGNPDLIPALVVTFCVKGVPFKVMDVAHLRLKESDRVESLIEECRRCGWNLQENENELYYDGHPRADVPEPIMIDPHGDHRIAMAFAVAGLSIPIVITHPEVVSKSFPGFFKEFGKLENMI